MASLTNIQFDKVKREFLAELGEGLRKEEAVLLFGKHSFIHDPQQVTVEDLYPRKEQQMKLYECVVIEHDSKKEGYFVPMTGVNLIVAKGENSAKMQAILKAKNDLEIRSATIIEELEVLCRPFVSKMDKFM